MTDRLRPFLPIVALFIAYLAWGAWAILSGERIPVNGGLGWDGQIYYFISKDSPEFVRSRVFDSYYIQRVLPSLIVRGMHRLTGTEHSYGLTGHFFGLLSLISMLGGTALTIASLRNVDIRWRWMAAIFSLVSFGSVRHVFYYPILTDAFAFLLGAAMLWAFLQKKKRVLALIALMGAFTVPTLLLLAFPLLVLRDNIFFTEKRNGPRWPLVILLLALTVLVLLGPAFNGGMPFGTFQPDRAMVLLGLPFLLGYVLYLFKDADLIARLRTSFRSIDRGGIAVWTAIAVAVAICAAQFRAGSFGIGYFLTHIPAFGLTHPAVGVVAHVTYLGPVVLMLLLHPGRAIRELNGLPVPLYWAVTLVLLLAIGSESRTLSAGLPFIIYLCVISLRTVELTLRRMAVLAVLSLLLSRFWFPINSGGMEGDFLEFPMQRYFMHIGPWMNTSTYLMQLAVTVVSGGVLWLFFREKEK